MNENSFLQKSNLLENGKELPPMKISKLYFLIHPGYHTDPRIMEEEEENDNFPPPETFKTLLEAYVKKAKSLDERDVMVVVSHSTRDQFNEDLKNEDDYALCIDQLQKELEERLVLVFDDIVVCDVGADEDTREDEAYSAIKEEFKRKNFEFDPATLPTVAFGESIADCVSAIANGLNVSADLAKPTIIDADLTDINMSYFTTGEPLHRELKGNREVLTHIVYEKVD